MALREMAHDGKCRCAQCSEAIYAQQLQFVQAIWNPVPEAVAGALDQQWQHIDIHSDSLWFSPPNLRVHELEQAPQQKPLARLK